MTCAICLGEFSSGETITLECGHPFHAKCVLEQFRRGDPKCALCRHCPLYENNVDNDEHNDEEDAAEENTRSDSESSEGVSQERPRQGAWRAHYMQAVRRRPANYSRFFATITRHKRSLRQLSRRRMQIETSLQNDRDEVNRLVVVYTDRLESRFRRRHATAFDELKTILQDVNRHNRNIRAVRRRVGLAYAREFE